MAGVAKAINGKLSPAHAGMNLGFTLVSGAPGGDLFLKRGKALAAKILLEA